MVVASDSKVENRCSLWRLPDDYENVSVDESSSSAPEVEQLASFDSGIDGDFKT